MRRMRRLLAGGCAAAVVIVGALSDSTTAGEPKSTRVFELRIYTTREGRLPALLARFRDHTMRIFKRHGMENVAYFTPLDEPKRDNTLVYFLAHKSREAATASWNAFRNDPEWKKVARESQKDGPILVPRGVKRQFLVMTDYSPKWPAPQKAENAKPAERIFELRIYTTNEGKLPDLHRRFRDHTMRIFEKHGIENIAYFTPVDEPNKLVYLIAHKSREAAEASWKAFIDDPEWKKAYADSTRNGKLVVKVERMFLTPTDFSPVK